MSEVDFVYDRGRLMPRGGQAIQLWAPAGFRPGVLHAGAPLAQAAGDVALAPDGRALRLWIVAEDAAGQVAAETLALGPGPARTPAPEPPAGTWVVADSAARGGTAGFRWSLAARTLFEDSRLTVSDLGRPEGPEELRPRSRLFALGPAGLPLRRPLRVGIEAPRAHRARGTGGPPAVALYRDSGGGWEYLGAGAAWSDGWLEAESRAPGRFALFRDVVAPRIRLAPAPRAAPPGPYPRWALEALLEEEGSGVDARSSGFLVDGRRVPSEWDAVAQRLRWRPLHPPARGRHEVVVVAADRAGNVRRRHAGFVLD
jgi:hypothetical protein